MAIGTNRVDGVGAIWKIAVMSSKARASLLYYLSYPIAWITFPGVMVRVLGRLFICKLLGVEVAQAKLFQFQRPFGYVAYTLPASIWTSLAIIAGPFFINTLAGLLIGFAAAWSEGDNDLRLLAQLFLLWLGVAIAKHAFAQHEEGPMLRAALKVQGTPGLAKVIGYPLMVLVYAGWIASVLFVDVLYGAFIAFAIPVGTIFELSRRF